MTKQERENIIKLLDAVSDLRNENSAKHVEQLELLAYELFPNME